MKSALTLFDGYKGEVKYGIKNGKCTVEGFVTHISEKPSDSHVGVLPYGFRPPHLIRTVINTETPVKNANPFDPISRVVASPRYVDISPDGTIAVDLTFGRLLLDENIIIGFEYEAI